MGTAFRVFLSGVSSEFGEARSLVASDLRSRGLAVKVQEDFRQEADSDTTLAKLHDYIRDCSAVVCIIGTRSGSVPPAAAGEPYAEMLPDGFVEASYTQWELLFARHYGRRPTCYRAATDYEPDRHEPAGKGHAELQARYVEWLFTEQGVDRGEFSNPDALGRLVLREDWPQPVLADDRPQVLPYRTLGRLFAGRDVFIESIRAAFSDPTTSPVKVLHGLGGVGKTRLAVEYAWRFLAEYTAVLFVSASTPEGLTQNLADLCAPGALGLEAQTTTEQDVQVAAVLGWLRANPGFLVIFDNLDTPEAAAAVTDLLPDVGDGDVLLTGRIADWGGDIDPLEVGVLDVDAATLFLLERTDGRRRHTGTDADDVIELAGELDGLALGLEQAGAYISQHRTSLAAYLGDWRTSQAGVRDWYDERLMSYPASVAVTWQTTISALRAPQLALLRILAFVAPEPFPLAVLETDTTARILATATHTIDSDSDSAVSATSALSGLAAVSMIRWVGDDDTIAVHRVVQNIMRDRLADPNAGGPARPRKRWRLRRDEPVNQPADWVCYALGIIDGARPRDPRFDVRGWSVWEPLRPHLAEALLLADRAGVTDPTTRLMADLAMLLKAKALYADGESLMRRALTIDETVYGPDHPEVAGHLNNLAVLLQATNRLVDAEPLMRRALTIDETVYGPDHPNVALRLSNLAVLFTKANRLVDAEPLMRRALTIDETAYGPDHPNVALRLSNLAVLLKDTNRKGDAEPLMRRVLTIDETVYGPDHPRVGRQLSNLAALLQATDRTVDAEPLMRRALTIDETAYGPDHPDVAIQLNNLAQLLQETGRIVDAEPLMRRALTIDESAYGPDHPDVASDLYNLAQLLQETGRRVDAEPLMRRAVEIFVAISHANNHEHQFLQTVHDGYVDLLRAAGRSDEEVQGEVARLSAPLQDPPDVL